MEYTSVCFDGVHPRHDASKEAFNLEETRDFMLELGPMVDMPSQLSSTLKERHKKQRPDAWSQYRRYVAHQPGPKWLSSRTRTSLLILLG